MSGKGKTVTTIEELGMRLEKDGYHIWYASSIENKVLRMLDMVLVFFKRVSQTDIVLIDTYSTFNFYYAVIIALLCSLKKLPYIPILHGGNLENRLRNSHKLSKKLFSKSYTNIAPSRFLETTFKKYGYTNLTYIPNAIELTNYPFKKRESVSCKLLWVRSFASLYNPVMAVKVCETLIARGYKAELCMVGPDKDGSLETCKSYALKNNIPVTFTGLLSKQEWIDLSKDYDVFINTTTIDNTPVSVLEAMALGLPVLSTNVGGIPFLIEHGENGWLVGSNQIEEMVEGVKYLLDNSEKMKSITANARAFVEDMDWEVVKLTWNKLLQ
ncbi:hypothetical protein NBRC110019_10990 [Neptunitalea chrysea]|uniref:Glycosyl transferase family 1 domain-containing protein n=1 Tax=Neptunitalea chrysea TaxID=1647581 RepID=A0A9W6B416_9FLAO|nr:hypothetical protein NBRC110019_10990 [Neptunitalea chrysea]